MLFCSAVIKRPFCCAEFGGSPLRADQTDVGLANNDGKGLVIAGDVVPLGIEATCEDAKRRNAIY